jgi:hypothetical protein
MLQNYDPNRIDSSMNLLVDQPDIALILKTRLTSNDEKVLELARDIAKTAFSDECRKGDLLEQRAFGLMQFAKVGLTTVAGVAGIMTIGSMPDSSFKECLLFWLMVSSCYLFKLFVRGAKVINVGLNFIHPHMSTFHRPDHLDVFLTQLDGNFVEALRKNVARMIFYLNQHVNDNVERVYNYKCCFVNTLGFLTAILIFSVLIVSHQLWPGLDLVLPGHQIIGVLLVAVALSTDFLWGKFSRTLDQRNSDNKL